MTLPVVYRRILQRGTGITRGKARGLANGI